MTEPEESRPRALRVAGVSRSYAGVTALADVSLSVTPGSVLGLIGPNGAGKSTLVNIISGYDRPSTGTILVDGRDVTHTKAHVRARRSIARTFQHGHLFDGLSVRENITVTAMATGNRRRSAIEMSNSLIDEFGLRKWADHAGGALPHGVERRVGVARALATSPEYVLLDEPAAGLNEGEAEEFAGNLRQIRERGLGVLLIDHNVKLILEVCDLIHVLVNGRTLLEGTAAQVRSSDELAEAYLGRSGRAQR